MARTIRADKFKRSCINNYDATKRIFRRMERQEGRKVIVSSIVETIEDARLEQIEFQKEQDSWDSFYAQEEQYWEEEDARLEQIEFQKEQDSWDSFYAQEDARRDKEEDARRDDEYWSNYWAEQDSYYHPMM
jgi:hypothetical protein